MTGTPGAAGTGWIPVGGPPLKAAPLRAVDFWRVEHSDPGLTMSVRVQVRGEDPNLRGHFPGLAVFPGVFVVEALCQAMVLALPESAPRLRTVRSVRFLAPLLDGDELNLEITATPRAGGGWYAFGEGWRSDGTAAARIRADFERGDADHADRQRTDTQGSVTAAVGEAAHA